ncbi:MAG: hypothetical protein WBZ32_07455 [Candidatus Acidiferrales bacterium]
MKTETKDAMAGALACLALAGVALAMAAGRKGNTTLAAGMGRATPIWMGRHDITTSVSGRTGMFGRDWTGTPESKSSGASDVVVTGTDVLLSANVELQYWIDANAVLGFPKCLDGTGNAVPGCTIGWRVCGNSGTAAVNSSGGAGQTAAPPFCVDVFTGSNALNVNLIENTSGQTTVFPIGSVNVTATLPSQGTGGSGSAQ